jgi:hypothetical protein
MKRFYIILIALVTSSSFFANKNNSLNSIKMTFSIAKNSQTWGADILDKDVQDCINYLKQLSEIQKKRTLTLEEITLGLHAAIFIISAEYEYHSGQIHITLNEKDKITFPFSSETLINLLAQSAQASSKNTVDSNKNLNETK